MRTPSTGDENRRRDEQGASAVEYGLLVAAIAAVIVIIVFALGGMVRDAFDSSCDTIAGTAQVNDGTCASG